MIEPPTNWSRNLTDESSIQKMIVLLTPSNDSNLPLKTSIFLFIKENNPQMLNQVGV